MIGWVNFQIFVERFALCFFYFLEQNGTCKQKFYVDFMFCAYAQLRLTCKFYENSLVGLC